MSQSLRVSNEQILSAAREVFLERGMRATTAEAAMRAGVSEALIFKRFGSKRALFERAMGGPESFGEADWLVGLEDRIGTGDVRTHLEQLAGCGIEFFLRLMPLVLMSWSHLDGHAVAATRVEESPQFHARRRVEAYFEAERALGRIRASDSRLIARFYMGALFHYAAWHTMFGAHDPAGLPPQDYALGVVDTLWRGIAPSQESP